MTGQQSIVARLRRIIEEMYKASEEWRPSDCAKLQAEAESLLPISLVDDVQIIVLREAADIVGAAGKVRMAMDIREVADGMTEDG